MQEKEERAKKLVQENTKVWASGSRRTPGFALNCHLATWMMDQRDQRDPF